MKEGRSTEDVPTSTEDIRTGWVVPGMEVSTSAGDHWPVRVTFDGLGEKHDNPFSESAADATAPDELESLLDQESVISGAEKNAVVARADEIRKKAREQEKERDRIRQEWRKAERQGRFFDALRLELELEDATGGKYDPWTPVA